MKKIVVILVSLFVFMMTANSVSAQVRTVKVNSVKSSRHEDINKWRYNLPATGTSDDDYPAVRMATPGSRVLTIGEIKALLPKMLEAAGFGRLEPNERCQITRANFESKGKSLSVWVIISGPMSNKKYKGKWYYYPTYVWTRFDESGNIVKSEENRQGDYWYAKK